MEDRRRSRSRSPRRGQHADSARRDGGDELPLADLLFKLGVLDERSVDYLKKAPIEIAGDILLQLGPSVRNPSAYVTKKLGNAGFGTASITKLESDGARHSDKSDGVWHSDTAHDDPEADPDTFEVYFNGSSMVLKWTSQEQVVQDLIEWGVLDERSADFLKNAAEQEARQILSELGPNVRNPSAFVTRKLNNMRNEGPGPEPQVISEPVTVYRNGEPITFDWVSKDDASRYLLGLGMLDERSADYLTSASEQVAKDVVCSLGQEVRNPSAFVTKKLKEIFNGAQQGAHARPRRPVPTITIYPRGRPMTLEYHSMGHVLERLLSSEVLDPRSADLLGKIPEKAAYDIINGITAEVRNPSAYATNQAKKCL